jgi:hypothetical protein
MTKAALAVRVLPLLAAVALSAGSSTYSTRRAALVPEIAPPMRSGAPMETIGEVSVNLPQAASTGDPTVADGQEPGLELPGFQVGGAGRLRLSQSFDMGVVYEQASSNGSRPVAADQPRVDGGDAYGYGLSFMGTAHMSDTWRMAFIGEFLSYSIPWVEYRTCIDNCFPGENYTYVDSGRTSVPVITLGMVPSWHSGAWTVFGGLSARNQPTIERGAIEVGDDGSDVESGRLNVMLSAGAEVSMGGGLKAMAMVYKSFDGSPLDYAPTLAVALSYGFGKPAQPAPPAPYYMDPPAPVAAPAPAPAPVTTERGAPSAER